MLQNIIVNGYVAGFLRESSAATVSQPATFNATNLNLAFLVGVVNGYDIFVDHHLLFHDHTVWTGDLDRTGRRRHLFTAVTGDIDGLDIDLIDFWKKVDECERTTKIDKLLSTEDKDKDKDDTTKF